MSNKIEWNYYKKEMNKRKHKISFEEAVTVFFDKYGVLFDDPEHSEDEERFLLLGYSRTNKICIVSHCYRDGDVIRIISARKATKNEREFYDKFNGGE